MHIPITIPLILSLTQLTSAIPYTTTSTSSTATSSLPPKEAISSSIAHETPSAFGAAGIKNNTAACPPSHASKQCCTNLGDQVEDILGQLGEVVPIVGEVTASSRTGLSCNAVVENSECGLSLMCCSGKPGRPKEDDETPSEGQQEVWPIYLSMDIY
ncbi:hypothetical protein ASPVEDRAFT_47169 [Aspergillus versicolor CBS 583.65]|uniref:Hydrophobin n=1 Tax=Aspergillus versicolor CBS 583.65 TaxID=1036611 RepID=A0A1L9Q2I5_ASPVE|nr:uncharacterized protein ASPVEDRAFT_47169 [Aspergillus versicolor CBS 583.65]OJJ07983.1 hypothetical protein ASPVEDRAFT_47169 [Aspergillus versicolor CBS 583.65]